VSASQGSERGKETPIVENVETLPGVDDTEDAPVTSGADLGAAVGWLALGAAILAGSITMDRLQDQDINPYTIPGLLPGLLGIAIMLLGGLLALRSLHRGAGKSDGRMVRPSGAWRRLACVIGFSVFFDTVLVGHGLPFWAGAAVYVASTIVALQHAGDGTPGGRLAWRRIGVATLIGLGAGAAVTIVFQDIFLVHLP
jgi:hypothetical protein